MKAALQQSSHRYRYRYVINLNINLTTVMDMACNIHVVRVQGIHNKKDIDVNHFCVYTHKSHKPTDSHEERYGYRHIDTDEGTHTHTTSKELLT